MSSPQVYIRDSSRATVGDAATWSQLTIIARLNDVGRWTIELADPQLWELFRTDMAEGWPRGVVILRDDQVICSGWADTVSARSDDGRPAWTVSGWDDMDYLAKTTLWPVPSNAIGDQSSKYDVVTGPGETRFKTFATSNMVDRLALPGVIVAPDLGRGGTHTSRVRFRPLLELAQRLHAGSSPTLAATCQQNLFRQIVVDMRERRDLRLTAQFSPDVGSAASWEYTTTAASYTRVIVGAGDEGVNRGLRLVTDEPSSNRAMRPEIFRDARDVEISGDWQAEADERGEETLTEHRATVAMTVSVNETDGMRYGPDFLTGDLVRAWLTDRQSADDPRVDDVITEAELTWTGGDFGTASIAVGPKETPEEYDARWEADVSKRISSLERSV